MEEEAWYWKTAVKVFEACGGAWIAAQIKKSFFKKSYNALLEKIINKHEETGDKWQEFARAEAQKEGTKESALAKVFELFDQRQKDQREYYEKFKI